MVLGFIMAQISQEIVVANTFGFATTPSELLANHEQRVSEFVIQFESESREFVPSWTGFSTDDGKLKISLKPLDSRENWFDLGTWSLNGQKSSKNDQSSLFGDVYTDTFISKSPLRSIKVRLEAVGNAKFESFQLSSRQDWGSDYIGLRMAISPLNVPMRAQMSYPGGNVLCSPTSVSMILSYWGSVLERSELNLDVPIVQKGVYDPAWPGTGNWSFNTAFAGSQPGMKGYVTRLRGIGDIEDWLRHKIPVACSVSSAMLKGAEKPADNDGHIVVVVGEDEAGNLIFNDPGRNVVRMTYLREDFDRAWARSGRTVYLVYPKFWRIPSAGPWEEKLIQEKSR